MTGAYHDILHIEDARGRDLRDMMRGHHYNYREQTWSTGNDHAHMVGSSWNDADTAPLVFCGADIATCKRGEDDWQALADEVMTERLTAVLVTLRARDLERTL